MSKGTIRPIDKMGRVVIPKEFRKELNVENEKDSFEIFQEGDMIVLKKYQPACIFCEKVGPSLNFGGYNVCKACIEKLIEEKDKIK